VATAPSGRVRSDGGTDRDRNVATTAFSLETGVFPGLCRAPIKQSECKFKIRPHQVE